MSCRVCMPPYNLDNDACCAISVNLVPLSGNKYVKTVAAAELKLECPEEYEGKFGIPVSVLILEFICVGRGLMEKYLASQHTMAAAISAILRQAKCRLNHTFVNL